MPKNRLKRRKPNPQRASLEFEVIAPITSTELESFAMEKILCKEFTAIPYLPSFCSECVLTLHKKHPTGPRPRNPKEGSFKRCESDPHGCPFSKLGPVDRKQVEADPAAVAEERAAGDGGRSSPIPRGCGADQRTMTELPR